MFKDSIIEKNYASVWLLIRVAHGNMQCKMSVDKMHKLCVGQIRYEMK